ncbi:MAG: beta-lactamase family protein [Culturomica sp.]|jgi:CubicO group peptidase (beta-lactamase class C family)|nr:beta-lactamase family protein [Culturomica sp.]
MYKLFIITVLVLVITFWSIGFSDSESNLSDEIYTEAEYEAIEDDESENSNELSAYPEGSVHQQFDRSVERFIKKWNLKGASFALTKNGKLVYAKGYGYADVEKNIHTEIKHIFRIASISKLITATGIMKLVEEGKLSLDSRVFGENGILNDSEYRDYKDKRFERITIDHLLRHQAGFSLVHGDPMFYPLDIARKMDAPAPADLKTMIRFVLSRRLGYTPGHSTVYSNIGYGILSKVIEKVSDTDYEEYIIKKILRPAGCYNIHIGRNFYKNRYKNEVRYYGAEGEEEQLCCDGSGKMVPKCYGGNNIEGLSGAGGWVASPIEMLHFLAVIDGENTVPDILKPETIKIMTSDNKGRTLPIGWMYANKYNWVRTGTLSGTSGVMKRLSNGYSWIFITNTSAWKGSKFPKYIDRNISQALTRYGMLKTQK